MKFFFKDFFTSFLESIYTFFIVNIKYTWEFKS